MPTPPPPPDTDTIDVLAEVVLSYFQVDDSGVSMLGTSILEWEVIGPPTGFEVKLAGMVVPRIGILSVAPVETTSYALFAVAPGGTQRLLGVVEVIVEEQEEPWRPPVREPVDRDAFDILQAVTLVYFRAASPSIQAFATSRLEWEVTGPVTGFVLTLAGTTVPRVGEQFVTPVETTSYALYARVRQLKRLLGVVEVVVDEAAACVARVLDGEDIVCQAMLGNSGFVETAVELARLRLGKNHFHFVGGTAVPPDPDAPTCAFVGSTIVVRGTWHINFWYFSVATCHVNLEMTFTMLANGQPQAVILNPETAMEFDVNALIYIFGPAIVGLAVILNGIRENFIIDIQVQLNTFVATYMSPPPGTKLRYLRVIDTFGVEGIYWSYCPILLTEQADTETD